MSCIHFPSREAHDDAANDRRSQTSVEMGTCAASEVLRIGSGFCYAKSHLLAALLRANGIPTALCYQRLSCNDEGTVFCLHGLNAVHLPEFGWYRIDARGNRSDVDAQFIPPLERLAFQPSVPGEVDVPGFFAEPLPVVVAAPQLAFDSRRTLRVFARRGPRGDEGHVHVRGKASNGR